MSSEVWEGGGREGNRKQVVRVGWEEGRGGGRNIKEGRRGRQAGWIRGRNRRMEGRE